MTDTTAIHPDRSAPVRVVIAQSQRLLAESLRRSLARDERIEVVGLACSLEEATAMLDELEPDLVLVGLDPTSDAGIETTRRMREQRPDTPVVVVAALDSTRDTRRALEAGAGAFVTTRLLTTRSTAPLLAVASLVLAFGADVGVGGAPRC